MEHKHDSDEYLQVPKDFMASVQNALGITDADVAWKMPMVRWKKKRYLWKLKYSASRIAHREWDKAMLSHARGVPIGDYIINKKGYTVYSNYKNYKA